MKKHVFKGAYTLGVLCGSLLVLSSLGCGVREGLAPVSGRLTFNGKPLAGIEIMFTPLEEKSRPSIGICDTDGNYSLLFTRTEKGGTIGRNRVSIVQPLTASGAPDYSVLRVPPKYGDESEMEYTIESGSNIGVDFDLKVPEEYIGGGAASAPSTAPE